MISLGTNCEIDLPRLLETRMLVQANSGGGKSWALRRLLESTAGQVQQLIIDPEGEFATLREKHDLIVCAAHDADAVVAPQSAGLLAKRLMEARVSAVLDIYDLKAHERMAFVRRFLEALVNAPKTLWHPALVILDEAHVFAPEQGKAESVGAVIDVATRGRKRGLCLVAATQRLAKLHKDVAAELLNKLIGRTGLDIDVRRAADELGMTYKDAREKLQPLEPGCFFSFGPALSRTVRAVRIGAVRTTHPKVGERLLAPPPAPSAKIRKLLNDLKDLPKQAIEEAKSLDDLRREIATLKRQSSTKTSPVTNTAELSELKRKLRLMTLNHNTVLRNRIDLVKRMARHVDAIKMLITDTGDDLLLPVEDQRPEPIRPRQEQVPDAAINSDVSDLRRGAIRILQELAARLPAGYSPSQVGALTRFAARGGTFRNYVSALRRVGYIEERDGLIYATEAGVQSLGSSVPDAPRDHSEAMRQWRSALRRGAYQMLEAIVEAGESGMTADDLAAAVDMAAAGGTFRNYLGTLKRNGLVTERGGICVATDILFPS